MLSTLLALAPYQQLEMPGSTLTQAGQQQICQWPQCTGNAWFHLLCSISKQAVLLQDPAAHVPRTHSLICACVTPTCVCCGRAIMPSLTQSTSITCCNLEHHHLVIVKGTASTPPPCTASMCICLHTATPLLNCAGIARHSHHYFTSCSSQASQLCFRCVPSEIICSCCCHA